MASAPFETPYVNALKDMYNNIGKQYNAITSTIHAGGPERLVEATEPTLKPGSWVLDLACGTGKVAFVAANKIGPTGRILGIDISDEFLGVARKAAKDLNISDRTEFLQRDVANLSLPEAYRGRWADAVTCGSSIAMFPSPGKMLDVLATQVLKKGGVFAADLWATNVPAKIFLDVAVPRGFRAPFDPLWLSDTEAAFRKLFTEADTKVKFELVRLESQEGQRATWDAGSEEKIEQLWESLAVQQTWLSFGLDGLGEEKVAEIKEAWVEELKGYQDGEGKAVKDMVQWIAVAVVKE